MWLGKRATNLSATQITDQFIPSFSVHWLLSKFGPAWEEWPFPLKSCHDTSTPQLSASWGTVVWNDTGSRLPSVLEKGFARSCRNNEQRFWQLFHIQINLAFGILLGKLVLLARVVSCGSQS